MSRFLARPGAEAVYYIISGASGLIGATMFTVYTAYFVMAAGLNPLQLVLVGTVLEGTYFLFEVPTGVVADTYSRRLSVILGMFLLGAAFVLIGAVPRFGFILLGQVISGVGYTFLSGATEAWLAGEVGAADVGRILVRGGQVERAAGLVGAVVSVALAGVQLNLPYLAGGAAYFGLGVFLLLAMDERGFQPGRGDGGRAAARPAWPPPWRTMLDTFLSGARAVRRSRVLMTLLGVAFIAGAASEGFDRLSDAHLLEYFAFPALGPLKPVTWFGIIAVGSAVLSLVAVEALRRRLEEISRDAAATAWALLVLSGLSAASVVAFGLASNFFLAVAALAARAIFGSLSGPLTTTWLVQNIDPEVRATVISMTGQSDAVGQIAGGPGIGLIGSLVSLRAAMVASGLLLSPASLLYARVLRSGGPGAPLPQPTPPRP